MDTLYLYNFCDDSCHEFYCYMTEKEAKILFNEIKEHCKQEGYGEPSMMKIEDVPVSTIREHFFS